MSTKCVLPKEPSTIAAQISLLADSNILNGGLLSTAALRSGRLDRDLFKGRTVKMGWFPREIDGKETYTINILVDESTDKKPSAALRAHEESSSLIPTPDDEQLQQHPHVTISSQHSRATSDASTDAAVRNGGHRATREDDVDDLTETSQHQKWIQLGTHGQRYGSDSHAKLYHNVPDRDPSEGYDIRSVSRISVDIHDMPWAMGDLPSHGMEAERFLSEDR